MKVNGKKALAAATALCVVLTSSPVFAKEGDYFRSGPTSGDKVYDIPTDKDKLIADVKAKASDDKFYKEVKDGKYVDPSEEQKKQREKLVALLAAAGVDLNDEQAVSEYFENADNDAAVEAALAEGTTETKKLELGEIASSLKVLSVSAIDKNEIKVVFNKAVEDTTKAVFSVKKGVANFFSVATWSEDKKEVVLKTTIPLPPAEYSVEVSGLSDQPLTEKITFEAEKVVGIVIKETQIERKASAPFVFEVQNQYGKDMKVASGEVTALAYNTTQKKEHDLTAVPTKSSYAFDANFATSGHPEEAKVGDVIRITLMYKGITLQHELTVIDVKAAETVVLGEVKPLEGKAMIFEGDTGLVLPVEILNQHGEAVKLSDILANADGLAGKETVDGVTFTSSDKTIIDIDNLTVNDGVVKIEAENKAGEATITAVVNRTGSTSKINVKVYAKPTVETFTITPPSTVVAAGDKVSLEYAAMDQYNNVLALKLATTIKNADGNPDVESINFGTTPLVFTSSDPTILDVDDITVDAKGVLTFETKANAGNVTVTVKNVAKVVGSLDIETQAAAVPTKISGISSTKAIDVHLVQNEEVEVKVENFVVQDQYGRAYELKGNEGIIAWMLDGTETIVDLGDETNYNKNGADHTNANAALLKNDGSKYLKLKGKAVSGSQKVRFQLTSNVTAADTNLVAGATFDVEFSNVAKPSKYEITVDKTELVAGEALLITFTAKNADESVSTAYQQSGPAKITLDSGEVYNKVIQFNNGVAQITLNPTKAADGIDVKITWDGADTELGAAADGDIKVNPGMFAKYTGKKSGTQATKNVVISAADSFGNVVTSENGNKLLIIQVKTGETIKPMDQLGADGSIVATFANGTVDLEIDASGTIVVGDTVIVTSEDGKTGEFNIE